MRANRVARPRAAVLATAACLMTLCGVSGAQPPNVIFDTDMWSDIDDSLALAMLHALHDRSEINLVAVTVSTARPWSVWYVDLVNTFYGRQIMPVGAVTDGVDLDTFRQHLPQFGLITDYTRVLSEQKTARGSLRYPRHSRAKPEEAVSVLRRTLAAQPDGSVVAVHVGHATNYARLLASAPDAISPLSGKELVKRKVRLLSIMAGSFGEVVTGGKTWPAGMPEFNLMLDVPAAQRLFSEWPTPIVASGVEIGLTALYPAASIQNDFGYVEHHPIAETYRLFCRERSTTIKKCPHEHPTFDLTSVLYAARPDRDYFSLSEPGRITVLPDGGSRFDASADGRHRYLILTDAQKARALEAMAMLASQPPVRKK